MPKIVLFFFIYQIALSQNTTLEFNQNFDSIKKEFIEVTRQKLQFKIDYNTDAIAYKFQKNEGNQNFELSPNQESNLRFSVNYKIIGFSYSFSPSSFFGNNDTNTKGVTKATGLTLNLNFKKFQQRFVHSKTTGYYLSNSNDFREFLNFSEPYLLLPNFKTISYESQTMFFLNSNKYSYKLARTQNEVQKRSAGSVAITFDFKYLQIDGREEDQSKFIIDDNFLKFPKIYTDYFVTTGIGYGYNYVYKNWYASGMIVPRIGVNYNKILTIKDEKLNSKSWVLGQISEFSVGYNTSTWFGGIFINGTANYLKNSLRSYSDNYNFASLFIGYRFETPKIIKKADSKINAFFKNIFKKKN